MKQDLSTRFRLLATARSVFAQRGFDGASVREITGTAGVNLGAITYHFGSKQGLYDAVMEEAFRPLLEGLARAPERADEAVLDVVERRVRMVFDHLRANPDLQFLVLQQITSTDMPSVAANAFAAIFGGLADRIAEGQRRGEIRAGDPLLMGISVVSQPAYFGLVARYVLSRLPLAGGTPSWDAIVEHGAGFVRAGLEARDGGGTT
jgi:AcrR family transcriptional regulator